MVEMNNTSRANHPMHRLVDLRLFACALLLWLCVSNVNADSAPEDTVLILGDSISAAYGLSIEDGWVAQLQQKIDASSFPLKVVNASVTGDTTANGLGRLENLLTEYEPRMLVIELGGNDGLRGLSIKKLKANLVSMAELANDFGALPVIVSVQLPGNYGRAYNKLFAKAFITAATETDSALVPSLFDGMDSSGEWFQTDGIHPSAKAQPVMLENVWRVIQPLLSKSLAQ